MGSDSEVEKTAQKEREKKKLLALSPIAKPLAGKKLCKRTLKLVRRAAEHKCLKRGVKEVVKSIRRGNKGVCVIAGNISPIDVITHVPILCEEAEIPYVYVPSKEMEKLLLLHKGVVTVTDGETMAAKPLTSEAIALTEKKMDMTLDDIIKMSKANSMKPKKQRVSNRGQKFGVNATQDKSLKARRFMDTRSSLRQGALALRRSNFQGNQFPLASEAARKAAIAPIRNRGFNQRRTFNVNKPSLHILRNILQLILMKCALSGRNVFKNIYVSSKQDCTWSLWSCKSTFQVKPAVDLWLAF